MAGPSVPPGRAIVVVLDGCGVGALPDASDYGDAGADTLGHLAQALGSLELPVLARLGLGCAHAPIGLARSEHPLVHGRLHALGAGKDSIAGHWELMGIVLAMPLPTYPDGVSAELLGRLRKACGHELIGNVAHNGLAAIELFGAAHMRTGALIAYTSTDSVLQLAAHVDSVEPAALYEACEAVRAVMSGANAVGRVIARPFDGAPGAFTRTAGRRDFALDPAALDPPRRSYLEELAEAGVDVHAVGKVADLFASRGIAHSHPAADNGRALATLATLLGAVEEGLLFVNLIDTDQLHGHRKDHAGFHEALRRIDVAVGELASRLRDDDLLVLTADHGVDMDHPSGDHTREHVPLLAGDGAMVRASLGIGPTRPPGTRHVGPMADVGATLLRRLGHADAPALPGSAFAG